MLASIFSLNVIQTALELGFIYALVALALFLSYSILNIADLSTDGCFTLGCAVACQVALTGHPFLALVAAMAAGVCSGFVTAFLQTRLGVESIMAGIIVNTGLYTINLAVMGFSSTLSLVKTDTVFSLAKTALAFTGGWYKLVLTAAVIALACVGMVGFLGTRLGLSIRATGDNAAMVRASSINPAFTITVGLCISGALTALSGGLLAQFQGSSDINMGRGAIVIGLAAVIIGEVIFGKLFTNFGLKLFAVSIGAVIYYIVLQIVLQLGLNTNDLKLITALIVAVFIFKVAFDLVRTGLNELLERSLPADVEEEILRIVTADPEVCQPHNLRTRRIGAAIAVEVHVRMDGAMTVARSHALTVDIERRLRARFGEGTMIAIHVEPLK